MSEPITREETYLAAIAGDGVDLPNPITREEMYLAAAAGMAVELPNPITRKEQFLQRVVETGGTGGGGVTIRNQNKTITQNGQYKADSGYTGLGTVTVNVPQEDPVLQDKTATQNGKYTADSGFDGLGTVTVAVPEPVLQDKTVTENGTVTADSGYDGLGKVTVNVAASGGSGDEDNVKAMLENNLEVLIHNTATKIVVSRIFQGNKVLRKVDLPNLTDFTGGYIFAECSALTEVNLPKLKTMSNSCFANCTGLTEVRLPNFDRFNNNGNFSGCTNLHKIDFGRKEHETYGLGISQNTFAGCSSLKVIICRLESKIVGLANINAFTNTPFASGGTGGTVYVPEAFISEYQAATNWSTLYAAGTCNFVAIEGSEYE